MSCFVCTGSVKFGQAKFWLSLNNTACLGDCTDRLVIWGKVTFGNFEIFIQEPLSLN